MLEVDITFSVPTVCWAGDPDDEIAYCEAYEHNGFHYCSLDGLAGIHDYPCRYGEHTNEFGELEVGCYSDITSIIRVGCCPGGGGV